MITIAFFDDFAVQRQVQLRRRYFPLTVHDESGYRHPEVSSTYASISYSPEQERYLLWYNTLTTPCIIGKQSEQCRLALAESRDGIHFQPAAVPGGESNFVYSGPHGSVHGAMVWRDEREADPMRRYKCAAVIEKPGSVMSYSPGWIATSPDGRQWDGHDGRYRWSNYWSDTYNNLFYNPVLQAYQVILRAAGTDRRICTSTSTDLIHWSAPRVILSPDAEDPPCSEFYGMSVFEHQGIFYGYLWIYETDQFDSVPYKMAGNVYSEFVYSLDGLQWKRTRQKAVPLNPPGQYGAWCNYLYNTCLNKEGNRWLTVGTFTLEGHGYGMYPKESALPPVMPHGKSENNIFKICSIEPGRFCGLQSVGLHGALRTKSLVMKSDVFTINAAVPNGELCVQLIDSLGKPVPGFLFEDSIPFRGDELAFVPRWRKRQLSEARDKHFAIEIQLQAGCIFGISGDFHPFHSSLPQQSYGDPRPAPMEVFGNTTKAPDYDGILLR
jgi:hypothetical protein